MLLIKLSDHSKKECKMSKKNLTEIVAIIDRSGSMSILTNDAIGGFNTFLNEQKKVPGDANFTLVLFDDKYDLVHDGKGINDVPDLNDKTYVPRGSTALLDAIGKTITTVGERLSNTQEDQKPEKVIVAILTDGEENASKEYKRKHILDMINHQRDKYSWEFIFLAANQDAIQEGMKFGIHAHDSVTWTASSVGVTRGYASLCNMTTNYRKNS